MIIKLADINLYVIKYLKLINKYHLSLSQMGIEEVPFLYVVGLEMRLDSPP